jgi:hypothetical protein
MRAALLGRALRRSRGRTRSIAGPLVVLAGAAGVLGAWLSASAAAPRASDRAIVFWVGASLFAYMAGASLSRPKHRPIRRC